MTNGHTEKQMPLWGAILILVLFVGLMFWGKYNAVKNGADFVPDVGVDSFEECAKLFPVMESYPEQCNTPDGQHFVNPDQKVEPFVTGSLIDEQSPQSGGIELESNLEIE